VGDVLAAHEALEPLVGPQVGRPADVDAHSAVERVLLAGQWLYWWHVT